MTERIWRAIDAEQIATEEIIPKYRPDLEDARVLFLFTDKERKSQGKVVWAKTSKLTGTAKYLSSGVHEDIDEGYDFQVLISSEIWNGLTLDQRRALVDHELMHCVGTESDDGLTTWSLQTHEIEEFTAIVKRHGAWHTDLTLLADAFEQIPLFAEEAT